MEATIDVPRAAAQPGVRLALVLAVAGSAGAGLVHVAAAREHQGSSLFVWMFAGSAAAQLLWALVARRAARRGLALGVLINGGALAVWALTRTLGIAFIASLADAQPVGTQDLVAASFAALSAAAALCILVRSVANQTLAPRWAGALAAFALLAALPAMAAGHEHHGTEHLETAASAAGLHEPSSHGATHTPSSEGTSVPDPTATTGQSTNEHAGPAPTDPAGSEAPSTTHGAEHTTTTSTTVPGATTTTVDPSWPTGPIISLDDPRVTAAQRAIAEELIADAEAGISRRFPDVAAIGAAGYRSIGDGGIDGFEHWVNWSYLGDSYELDADHIESIVVKKNADGTSRIVSAMYILTLGKTMDDVPTLAGELTTWHDHQNLCFVGTTVVGLAVDGVCAVGTLLPTPPMLHVWIEPNPCGPFAGIETHGATCDLNAL